MKRFTVKNRYEQSSDIQDNWRKAPVHRDENSAVNSLGRGRERQMLS